MLKVSTGARTDVGRVRRSNEDSLVVGRRLWAVADGMGGHAAGNVASALIAERLGKVRDADALTPDDVVAAIRDANKMVLGYGLRHPRARGLGSTVTGVAAVVADGAERWMVFNVGDSRVYVADADGLHRITVDHSEVEELVSMGLLTPEQARVHPLRNAVTRSLGSRPAPQVDAWIRPQVPGERFVVCSDGLNSEVPDAAIARILSGHPDPDAAASALVEAALAAGGHDNVTVVVVDVGDFDDAAG